MAPSTPPARAVRLLKRCLSDEAFEAVAGDLDEELRRGRSHAWYWRQVLRSVVAHGAGRVLRSTTAFSTDLRLAARALSRQRRLLIVATTTLGLGVALCITVLAAVNAYLWRGLPYPHSDRLHHVLLFQPGIDLPRDLDRLDWRSLDDVVELSIAWDLDVFNLRGAPHPEAAQGTWVTPHYMEGFGVRTALGRAFEPDDYAPDGPAVAIISHRLWQRRFGGDPSVIGRTFQSFSNDRPQDVGVFTIVGVLPDTHWHYQQAFTDVMAPLRVGTYPYLVRLRPGASAPEVRDRIEALIRARHDLPSQWRVSLVSALDQYVTSVRPLLLTLGAAASLILLIAAANVGVLLLVRASERRPEMAVRRALGATGLRLARGIVAEAVVLGGLAGGLGLGAAAVLLRVLAPLVERSLGRGVPGGASALDVDGVVWLGALAATALIVLLCSVLPVWAAARAQDPVNSAQKGALGSRAQQRARMALVVTEIAACLSLLVGAALMVQSGLRMLGTDIGIDASDVTVTSFQLNQTAYPTPAARRAALQRVTESANEMPSVTGLALANSWPLQQAPEREVTPAGAGATPARTSFQHVSDGYFDVLRIPMLDGRAFGPQDRGAPFRVIVSRTLAERLWPGERAVGRSLTVAPSPQAPAGTPPATVEVIGVAGDTRHSHLDTEAADMYGALSQVGGTAAFVYLRSSRPTNALEEFRASLARIDPDLSAGSPRQLADILDQQRAGPRFLAQLLVVFSAAAALLALVGIHGVVSYAAAQRRREVALRLAIGASRADITRLFLGQGVWMVAIGLAAGLLGARGLAQLLGSQLFGVSAGDPVIIGGTAAAFGLCALIASLGPARRAGATDPAVALREP